MDEKSRPIANEVAYLLEEIFGNLNDTNYIRCCRL